MPDAGSTRDQARIVDSRVKRFGPYGEIVGGASQDAGIVENVVHARGCEIDGRISTRYDAGPADTDGSAPGDPARLGAENRSIDEIVVVRRSMKSIGLGAVRSDDAARADHDRVESIQHQAWN